MGWPQYTPCDQISQRGKGPGRSMGAENVLNYTGLLSPIGDDSAQAVNDITYNMSHHHHHHHHHHPAISNVLSSCTNSPLFVGRMSHIKCPELPTI